MLIFTALSSHTFTSSLVQSVQSSFHGHCRRHLWQKNPSPFFAGRHQPQPPYSICMFLQSVSSRCHKFSPSVCLFAFFHIAPLSFAYVNCYQFYCAAWLDITTEVVVFRQSLKSNILVGKLPPDVMKRSVSIFRKIRLSTFDGRFTLRLQLNIVFLGSGRKNQSLDKTHLVTGLYSPLTVRTYTAILSCTELYFRTMWSRLSLCSRVPR